MGPMERLGHAVGDWRTKLHARGIDLATLPPVPDSHRETLEDRRDRLQAQARNRAARWVNRLPVMYADAAVADLTDAQGAVQVQGWLGSGSSTLLLAGPIGTGKTHAAYAVGHQAVAAGLWVEAWTLGDLLEACRPGGDPVALDAARNADVLVLDDLLAAKVSDWAVEQFTSLMDHRLRNQRRQVVTTNAAHADLLEAWGARALDRLRFRWTVVALTGESRRVAAW